MAARRIVFVTGGNSGIGYETAKAFLQSKTKPYHVLLGSRTLSKANQAIETLHKECPDATNTIEAVPVDLVSDESIEKAYEQVKTNSGHIDALINNAGMYLMYMNSQKPFTKLTFLTGATFDIEYLAGRVSLRECFNKAYDVNVAGTNVLTWTFMPLLLKSTDPRLIFVSGLAQITSAAEKYFPTPPQPAGWPKQIDFETIGYRCSKVALNMLMLDWNHKLKADGVKVWGVGPGFLATNLGNMPEKAKEMGGGHPSIGADIIKKVAEGERDADVGKLVNKDGLSKW